jgi:hypothetical protein
MQGHVTGRGVKVLAEELEWTSLREEKACLDCPMTKKPAQRDLQRLLELSTISYGSTVGYVWDSTGEIQFDPDEQVQQVVRLIFRTFEELGTLGGLVRYLAHHQIQLGVRVREGQGYGELIWRRPNRATLQTMLKHPLYAGSYV